MHKQLLTRSTLAVCIFIFTYCLRGTASTVHWRPDITKGNWSSQWHHFITTCFFLSFFKDKQNMECFIHANNISCPSGILSFCFTHATLGPNWLLYMKVAPRTGRRGRERRSHGLSVMEQRMGSWMCAFNSNAWISIWPFTFQTIISRGTVQWNTAVITGQTIFLLQSLPPVVTYQLLMCTHHHQDFSGIYGTASLWFSTSV